MFRVPPFSAKPRAAAAGTVVTLTTPTHVFKFGAVPVPDEMDAALQLARVDSGGATTLVAGKSGNAVKTTLPSAPDYLRSPTCPADLKLVNSTKYGFSVWVSATVPTGSNQTFTIFSTADPGTAADSSITLTGGPTGTYLLSAGLGRAIFSDALAWGAGFHHIMISIDRDSAVYRLWVDGVQISTSPGISAVTTRAADRIITHYAFPSATQWNNITIDEMYFWVGYAPTAADMTFLYNGGTGRFYPTF
jgi:hypothetical protein